MFLRQYLTMATPALSNFPFVFRMESEWLLLLHDMPGLHGLFPHSLLSMSFPGFQEDEARGVVTWLGSRPMFVLLSLEYLSPLASSWYSLGLLFSVYNM